MAGRHRPGAAPEHDQVVLAPPQAGAHHPELGEEGGGQVAGLEGDGGGAVAAVDADGGHLAPDCTTVARSAERRAYLEILIA